MSETTAEPAAEPAPAATPAAKPRPVPVHSPLRRVLLTMLIPLGVGAICLVAVSLYVMSGVRNHPAVAQALAAVRADPAVIEALGTPLEPGFVAQGGEDPATNRYEAMFSVEGPKGEAGVRLLAKPAPGGSGWELTFLDVGANLDDGRSKVLTLVNDELPVRFGVQRDALAEDAPAR